MGFVQDILEFRNAGTSKSGKTKVWEVINRYYDNEVLIGHVQWFGRWRCYAFFPEGTNTVFEYRCLREIAEFLQDQTDHHFERGDYRT